MHLTCLTVEALDLGIWHITLTRPEKLNALNHTVLMELKQVLLAAKTDATCRGLLLTGAGKAFCAGADIQRLQSLTAPQALVFAQEGQEVFRLLESLAKPSLAAVNGFAFGGGCELAMAAHLRIAHETARFGLPEVKLGVIPCYGGTQRLTRLIGKGRALDLCLTGRFIDAQLACQWGLVSEVVSGEALLPRAIELLSMIIHNGPIAVHAVQQVIDQGADLPLNEALALEALHFSLTCASEDKQEGVQAFLEKRPAHFKGQ